MWILNTDYIHCTMRLSGFQFGNYSAAMNILAYIVMSKCVPFCYVYTLRVKLLDHIMSVFSDAEDDGSQFSSWLCQLMLSP